MHIREAEAEDALLISRIIAASWRGAYHTLIDPVYLTRLPEEAWLPSMRSWLSSGRMYGYIAELDGTPVGCVIYGRGRDEDHADWGEIVSLYLLPEWMGQGIGSALLAAALDALHAEGYHRVYLWAIEGFAPTLSFYRNRDFLVTEDRVEYKIGSSSVTDVRLVREETDG